MKSNIQFFCIAIAILFASCVEDKFDFEKRSASIGEIYKVDTLWNNEKESTYLTWICSRSSAVSRGCWLELGSHKSKANYKSDNVNSNFYIKNNKLFVFEKSEYRTPYYGLILKSDSFTRNYTNYCKSFEIENVSKENRNYCQLLDTMNFRALGTAHEITNGNKLRDLDIKNLSAVKFNELEHGLYYIPFPGLDVKATISLDSLGKELFKQ